MSIGAKMKSMEHCGVCGTPLKYGTKEITQTCAFCDDEFRSSIYCPKGHYICDACHSLSALDILREILGKKDSTCPSEILEEVMARPTVPTHGPEHHAMVPAILVRAAENAGYPVPGGAVNKAIERGIRIPGGWCGSHGVCGAAIGVGIAVSVLTGATPLTGETRALANEATTFILGKMADDGPRCCKRASRKALESAVEFLDAKMDIHLSIGEAVACTYSTRNKECILTECPYFKPQ
jgi:hypothetical protein